MFTFRGKKRKKKESKTMHGELTHQADKINLQFIHWSLGGRREKSGWQFKKEKIDMLKLCISTLSWHCGETLSSCFVWPCQEVTMIYCATSIISMRLISHRKQWQVRLTAVWRDSMSNASCTELAPIHSARWGLGVGSRDVSHWSNIFQIATSQMP